MTKNRSSGILLYRHHAGELEVFLVHPGGPYWEGKETLAWSIPKGEIAEGEQPLETAKREFYEETGSEVSGDFQELTPQKQRSGKIIYAWAVEGDFNPSTLKSNTFTIEWPPRSGLQKEFPEIDKGAWFVITAASEKILPGQRGFLDQLQDLVDRDRKLRS